MNLRKTIILVSTRIPHEYKMLTGDFDEKNNIDISAKLLLLILSSAVMYIFPNVNELPLVGGYIVFLSIIFIIKSYKNIMSFIVALFLFWFNYSIIFANYFLDMHSFYLRDSYSAVSVIGLRVLLIFNLILCLFTKIVTAKTMK